MSNFPLYDTLKNKIKGQKKLTVSEKKKFLEAIPNLDSDGQELVYVLIKCHYIENNKGEYTFPYNPTISNGVFTFDFSNFPNELQQILYKFVLLHLKKLEEDKKIEDAEKKLEKEKKK